jgi:transcriptional regulator with XRE-family HTH domain
LTIFGYTLEGVTTEGDPLRAFRAALARCREELGLTYVEAGQRAGISGQRWRSIEIGYEVKAGNQIPANPRRDNLIKMARAVEIPVDEALRLAGLAGLTAVESRRIADNPRRELTRLITDLPEPDVQLLVDVAKRLSIDAAGPDPAVRVAEHRIDSSPENTTPPVIPNSRDGDPITP